MSTLAWLFRNLLLVLLQKLVSAFILSERLGDVDVPATRTKRPRSVVEAECFLPCAAFEVNPPFPKLRQRSSPPPFRPSILR